MDRDSPHVTMDKLKQSRGACQGWSEDTQASLQPAGPPCVASVVALSFSQNSHLLKDVVFVGS